MQESDFAVVVLNIAVGWIRGWRDGEFWRWTPEGAAGFVTAQSKGNTTGYDAPVKLKRIE